MIDLQPVPAVARPPRPVLWVALVASAGAVLLVGAAATTVVFTSAWPRAAPDASFWLAIVAASSLTVASIGLRALRWIFLLRRTEARIPLREACIAYLSGFSLLLAPFLLGEVVIRAYVHRARGDVPRGCTVVLNLWERLLDLNALVVIAGAAGLTREQGRLWSAGLLLASIALTLSGAVRRTALRGAAAAVGRVMRVDCLAEGEIDRLSRASVWTAAMAVSLVAWILPGTGLWAIARVWKGTVGLGDAQLAYATSTLAGALALAPGGVVVAGGRLLDGLARAGFSDAAATLCVIGIRLATAGVTTALGVAFLGLHFRTRTTATLSHFDAIAEAYDVQIPEARRRALLTTKTALMQEVLSTDASHVHGLDAGCGQGWHLARMRELGYDIAGIDTSTAQLQLAARLVGWGGLSRGSVLDIPAPTDSYDFVYVINVLHHLPSVSTQRSAFTELLRVLRPNGLLFVHEINTRNLLFRFYMGYVFPSMNCIDEGVERWLRPDELQTYTSAPLVTVRYFTFLPDFLPERAVRLFAPLERYLERSTLNVYSAHYMAVLRKPA